MLETCVICVLVSLPQCSLPIVKAFKARLDIKKQLIDNESFFWKTCLFIISWDTEGKSFKHEQTYEDVTINVLTSFNKMDKINVIQK